MPIYVKCKARDNQGKMRQIKLFLLTFCPSHQSEAGGCICLLMKESNRYVLRVLVGPIHIKSHVSLIINSVEC